MQTEFLFAPIANTNFQSAALIANTAMSDYDALQVQFQRRLSRGLQALASYTWSHSIDDASAGSFGNSSNTLVPTINPRADRGPSDFDIRHALTAAITYEFPTPKLNAVASAVLKGWSVENEVQARSAPPVDVFDQSLFELRNAERSVRPDVIPGGSRLRNSIHAASGSAREGRRSWRAAMRIGRSWSIDALSASEHRNWTLAVTNPTCLAPRYERCMVPLSDGGGDQMEWREFDLASKAFVQNGFVVRGDIAYPIWKDRDTLYVNQTGSPGDGPGGCGPSPEASRGRRRTRYIKERRRSY